MADPKTRRVAELVGLLGVIASLVFVGVEIRQNSIATRAATDAAVADGFRELNLVMASSPDLAAAFAAGAEDPAGAPAEAQMLMLGFYRALFHIWSNGHRQHLNGTIDPAVFQAIVQEISTYAADASGEASLDPIDGRRRLTRWAWESERFIFNPDFQAFVDSILASGSWSRQTEGEQMGLPILATILAIGATLPQEDPVLSFDHVFTLVDEAGPTVSALSESGFTVLPDTSHHTGQGTASRAVIFDNGYLELIWIDDPEELRAADSTMAGRLLGPESGAPYGLGLALASDVQDPPFQWREYRAAYLPPGTAIQFGDTRLDEPAVFVVPRAISFVGRAEGRPPFTEMIPHANGARRITAVRFHRPAGGRSEAFGHALEDRVIETGTDDTTWLEVEIDSGRQGRTLDLQDSAGLVIRY